MRSGVILLLGVLWTLPLHAQRRGSARIEVQSSVTGAAVLVDGRKVGTTPVGTLWVTPGKHKVKVKKLGHLDHDEEIVVAANGTAQIVADLLPFAGVLSVKCNAPGATVVVDGRAIGQAPLERELEMGSHVIKVMATGFGEYTDTITAVPGEMLAIAAVLRPVAAPVDDLELAPLAPSPAPAPTSAPAPARVVTPEPEPELELELLPAEPELEPPPMQPRPVDPSPEPDLLDLEAVPLPVVEPQPSGPFASGVAATAPASPWWQRWYSIAGAGAAVATATVVVVLLVRGGGSGQQEVDGRLRFGESPNVLEALTVVRE